MEKIAFSVKGMTCESCKEIIEDIAKDFPEVEKCHVDLPAGNGWLEYKDGFDINRFQAEINGIGKYTLEFIS